MVSKPNIKDWEGVSQSAPVTDPAWFIEAATDDVRIDGEGKCPIPLSPSRVRKCDSIRLIF